MDLSKKKNELLKLKLSNRPVPADALPTAISIAQLD